VNADRATGARWWAELRRELAPTPGRLAAVARVSACCALVVIIWMTFEIPLPAYAAYVALMASRAETSSTLMTSIGALVAVTLAVLFTLVIYTFDASEPAVRLPLMALSTFIGMYLTRVIVVGQIAFLTGFVLVLTQSLVGDVPTLEALTRFVLWLWVIVVAPAVIVSVVDLVFGQRPMPLVRDRTAALFDTLTRSLEGGNTTALANARGQAADIAALCQRAKALDADLKARAPLYVSLLAGLDELVRMATLLQGRLSDAALAPILAACRACQGAVLDPARPIDGASAMPGDDALLALAPQQRSIAVALARVLERMKAGAAQWRSGAAAGAPRARVPFFVGDAFTNPEHVRFALKATLAALSVYILYEGLDWQGIRTSLVTCFFVALGSLGETVHKLVLRLSGALIGGVIAGLCIVYLLPHMTDIGQLALLVIAVTAPCAWVAAGSERLSYAGMQMAFAFFIGVLQGYAPADDLTVLRDRVAGIVLGNVAMSLVFATVWPVSAVRQARHALASAAQALAALVERAAQGADDAAAHLGVARSLAQAERLISLGRFELLVLMSRDERIERAVRSLDALQDVSAAALVAANQPAGRRGGREHEVAEWLKGLAQALREGRPAPPAPGESLPGGPGANAAPAATPLVRSALEAHALLLSRTRDAAASAS